jgi:hypothetical protein
LAAILLLQVLLDLGALYVIQCTIVAEDFCDISDEGTVVAIVVAQAVRHGQGIARCAGIFTHQDTTGTHLHRTIQVANAQSAEIAIRQTAFATHAVARSKLIDSDAVVSH